MEQLSEADAILHAGDFAAVEVLDELEALRAAGPRRAGATSTSPRAAARLPERQVVEVGGARIGMVHVPGPAQRARLSACGPAFPDADAVVFGHTHMPEHARGRRLSDLQPRLADRAPPRAREDDGHGDGRGRPRRVRAARGRLSAPPRNSPPDSARADHRLASSSVLACARGTPSDLRPRQPAPVARFIGRPVTRRATDGAPGLLRRHRRLGPDRPPRPAGDPGPRGRRPAAVRLRRGHAAPAAALRRPAGPRRGLPHALPRRPLAGPARDAQDVRPARAREAADDLRPARPARAVRRPASRSSGARRTRCAFQRARPPRRGRLRRLRRVVVPGRAPRARVRLRVPGGRPPRALRRRGGAAARRSSRGRTSGASSAARPSTASAPSR